MALNTKRSEPRKGFTQILNAVIDNPNLCPRDKLVLFKVASHAYGTRNVANPSQKAIADSLGYRRETVKAAYDSLASLRILRPHGDGRKGRQETFTIDLDRAANLTTQSAGTGVDKPSGNVPSSSSGNLTTESAAPDDSVGINKSRARQIIQEDGSAAPEGSSLCESAEAHERDDDGTGNVEALPRLPATPGRKYISAPASESVRTFSKAEVNAGFITPEGHRVSSAFEDLEPDVSVMLAWVYGEPLKCADLDRLVAERGVERCALWAHWLPRKIADEYERKRKPVDKPTGLYIDAVRGKWPVNPKWPEFDEHRHTVAAREEFEKRKAASRKVSSESVEPDDEDEAIETVYVDEVEEAFGGAVSAVSGAARYEPTEDDDFHF